MSIEAYRSLAEQAGVELRSVAALAKAHRLRLLFDSAGTLRRFGASPEVAHRRLRDVRRRWATRGDVVRLETRGDVVRLGVPDHRTLIEKLSELATTNRIPLTDALIQAAEAHGIGRLFDSSSGRYIGTAP